MKKTVGIIGAGAWGTALAVVAARGGNPVLLWCSDEKKPKEINQRHWNPSLNGVSISREIIATSDMADLKRADIWLIATPTEFFSKTVQKSRPFWQKQPIIICSKGIEPQTGRFLSDVVADIIPGAGRMIGVLSGPQFAAEVAAGKPTGSTVAGSRKVFDSARCALPSFILEESNDVYGVQICGAGKNVVAMLMGYLDAQGAGENERALKLTLAWQEIISFSRLFRAKMDTFGKLCGIGDLFLSATSKTSRNYSAGVAMATGKKVTGTVEGIAALKWIISTAKKNKLHLPVLEKVSKVFN
ncbi:MAG: hypothetical protein FWE50_02355 [Alphaproteobacteria bacterium]|nr:hypothetical protein [Alphaproteobacteria bacterium]